MEESLKKEIVRIYQEDGFWDAVLHCEDEGIINRDEAVAVMKAVKHHNDPSDPTYWDYKPEVICTFFDGIGIGEEYFK